MDLAAFRSFLIDRVNAINAAIVVTTPEQDVEELPDIQVVTASSLPRSGRNFAPSVNSDNPGLLQFTSATGGRSKGVQLSQCVAVSVASAIAKAVHFDPASDVAVKLAATVPRHGPRRIPAHPRRLRRNRVPAVHGGIRRPSHDLDGHDLEGARNHHLRSAVRLRAKSRLPPCVRKTLSIFDPCVAFVGAERNHARDTQAIHAGLGPAGLSAVLMPAYGMAEIALQRPSHRSVEDHVGTP